MTELKKLLALNLKINKGLGTKKLRIKIKNYGTNTFNH
jgi:hypothetical protein